MCCTAEENYNTFYLLHQVYREDGRVTQSTLTKQQQGML